MDAQQVTYLSPAVLGLITAIGVAGSVYALFSWVFSHLSERSNQKLTLWLRGEYESSWADRFCDTFDTAFGDRHLSWKCFARSSLVSITTVAILYFLLQYVFRVIGPESRAGGSLELLTAVFIGSLVNIVPDYLSLLETRWLLKQFKWAKSVSVQFALLILDFAFSGAIIFAAIFLYESVYSGQSLTVVETVALFSIYSIFFYSTFTTSAWALVFCITTWITRLFNRTQLFELLDTDRRPGRQIAFVGSLLVFVIVALIAPLLSKANDQEVSPFDEMLCSAFPSDICPHLGRLSRNPQQILNYHSRACLHGAQEECFHENYDHENEHSRALIVKHADACERGDGYACRNLGYIYSKGDSRSGNFSRTIELYERGCDLQDGGSCYLLSIHKSYLEDETFNLISERDLIEKGCKYGHPLSCTYAGNMHLGSYQVKPNLGKAFYYYRRSCDLAETTGCAGVANMLDYGWGTAKDRAKSARILKNHCDDFFTHKHPINDPDEGEVYSCLRLATKYLEGHGVTADVGKSEKLFRRVCEKNVSSGCTALGYLYERGRFVPDKLGLASYYYAKACELDGKPNCIPTLWNYPLIPVAWSNLDRGTILTVN